MKCDPSLLWTLVNQTSEPDADTDSVTRHVATCVQCQATLQDLGGDPTWWDDAKQWLALAGDEEFDVQELPLPPIDLSFLDQPTHPEMLGRIGRYDVEGVLGRGGMGVVLRAYDSDLHRSVAVKVMAPEWAASLPARQRFAREAQAAASVAHENVIPIFDVEPDATLPYLVMRFISGMTLQQWVKANEPLDVRTILVVAEQLAEGLSAAHRRGLIHRDIKPANVLVGKNIERIWITDFGLARAADSVTLTRTGVIAGTPNYMSPEQARGESIDQRSDLFSLGCVLYFLATGRPPFDSDNTLAVLHKIVSEDAEPLAATRDDLPPSFVNCVHELLSRKPGKRQPDCDVVIAQLMQAREESGAGVVAKPPWPRSVHRTLWGVVAASVLGFLTWLSPLSDAVTSIRAQPLPQNPFDEPVDRNEDFSPYLVQASKKIESTTSMDAQQFQSQVEHLRRKLHKAQSTSEESFLPTLNTNDSSWRHQVSELQELLQKANSTSIRFSSGI